jgi:hypothetical protein
MGLFEDLDQPCEGAVVIAMPPGNDRVGGRLRYDPQTGITLDLLDVVRPVADFFAQQWAHYPVLVGHLVNGPPFTLVDCAVDETKLGAAGFAQIQVVATQLLVGGHFLQFREALFEEMYVSLTLLSDWFGERSMSYPPPDSLNAASAPSLAISSNQLPRIGFSPLNGGPSLESHQNVKWVLQEHHGSITNNFALKSRPRNIFGLDACMSEVFRLQSFFSLLCGLQLFCTGITLKLREEGNRRQQPRVDYMSRLARPRNRTHPPRPHILLPLPSVRAILPDLWCAWTANYELYRTAVELYSSTELFADQLLDFQLLAVMQALETLHRNRFGGTYLTEGEYKPVNEALRGAIPPNVSDDLRNALKAKLQYGNDYSLRKRLKELLRKLPQQTADLIHPNLAAFLDTAVSTRNFLTHRTAELEKVSYQGAELYSATRLLRWFFLAVLLTDLGLPSAILSTALAHSSDLKAARYRCTARPSMELATPPDSASCKAPARAEPAPEVPTADVVTNSVPVDPDPLNSPEDVQPSDAESTKGNRQRDQ